MIDRSRMSSSRFQSHEVVRWASRVQHIEKHAPFEIHSALSCFRMPLCEIQLPSKLASGEYNAWGGDVAGCESLLDPKCEGIAIRAEIILCGGKDPLLWIVL